MASVTLLSSSCQVPFSLSSSFPSLPSARCLNALPASSISSLGKIPAVRQRNALDYLRAIISQAPTSGKLNKIERNRSSMVLQKSGVENVSAPHVGRLENNEAAFRLSSLGIFGTLSLPLQQRGANKIGASKTASTSMESGEPVWESSEKSLKSKRRVSKKSRGAELIGPSEDAGDAVGDNSKLVKAAGRVRKKSSSSKTKSTKKPKDKKENVANKDEEEDDGEGYDDMMDIPYESPGLVCCFGAAQREFVPTVRVSERQMHPDIYSSWKGLQWSPPEFARAPGGPPSNVAIAHVRLGGRAAFIGKVGNDEFGKDLVYKMNTEKVQTRAVKIDPSAKTAVSYMKIICKDGKLSMKTVKECAEDSLQSSELNLAVLKEAKMFHFNSEVLTSPSMHAALFRAIRLSKKFGGLTFFDLNLPLPLWRSREETREVIKEAWNQADIIELTKQELEFLLDEEYYEKKREYRPQYYAESYEQTKRRRNYYHYTREEISSLWHDKIKVLFITDGLFRIHYYTPHFDGTVIGTEDVLITPFTCDRTGSGDALVAGIMRKLVEHPEVYEDQDKLERNLRFAIAAGIISQWTIGAVRGFPTESATQNLKEQVYIPSMW